MAGQAYVKSFSMEKYSVCISHYRVCPLNADIFPEHAFLRASVIDIPLNLAENDTQQWTLHFKR